MGAHKTKEEWIQWFIKYEQNTLDWNNYYLSISFSERPSRAKERRKRTVAHKKLLARGRFFQKYNEWKKLDNTFMTKKIETRGRKSKRDIEGFISNLTIEELKEIARVHIEQNEKSKIKKGENYHNVSKGKTAFILNVHRSTLYRTGKPRIYKFDIYQKDISDAFHDNLEIYGRQKLMIYLKSGGIMMNERTLGRYLARYGLVTKTRKRRKNREIKNTNVKFPDLVQRDFNPAEDHIIATDVSYIAAGEIQNNIYLSVAISHKTKKIESYKVSKSNDTKLVVDTIKDLKRTNFVLHSDHGFQYSSFEVLDLLKSIDGQTSMSRIGNSLDNREIEYFFGCLKGEYLNHFNTSRMKFEEIVILIDKYIYWYNNVRIQSRLNWKTPTEIGEYTN